RLPRLRQIEAPLRAFLALTTVLLLCATVLHREDHDGFQASHLFFMPRYTWEMDQGRGMLYEEAYYERMDLDVLAREVYGSYSPREYEYEYEERVPVERTAPPPSSTAAYRDWLAAERESYTSWFAEHMGEYVDWLETEAATFDEWLAAQPAGYRAAHEAEVAGTQPAAEADAQPATTADALSSGGSTQGHTVRRAPHAPAPGGTTLPILGAVSGLDAPGYQFEPVSLPRPAPTSREDDTPSPPPRPADSI
ncbi:MAG TPA: hypothetical protein VFR15_00850, partial [Chloroflexia bacterium]|nr:hypothetical protein [Chloroflexia bacterium]